MIFQTQMLCDEDKAHNLSEPYFSWVSNSEHIKYWYV